jgi:hypothetical protein
MRKLWPVLFIVSLCMACHDSENFTAPTSVAAVKNGEMAMATVASTASSTPAMAESPIATLTPEALAAGPLLETPAGDAATPVHSQLAALAAPAMTPTWDWMKCYNQPCMIDLVSPDGQYRWPQECRYLGIDIRCQILFPNGQKSVVYNWPLEWSPTGAHLLVPIGGNHDTPASGYELWNMLTATRVAELNTSYPGWIGWSPDGGTILYVKRGSPDAAPVGLVSLDAGSGVETATRQCPVWQQQAAIQSGDDYRFWLQYCDNVAVPSNIPVILNFTVEPTEVSPGETVTLRWQTSGGVKATLRQNENANFQEPIEVPTNGTMEVTTRQDQRGWIVFEMELTAAGGNKDDYRDANLMLKCLDNYFFSGGPSSPTATRCAYRPAAMVLAAEQPFEHGRMIWLDAIPAANSAIGVAQSPSIYVLYDTGKAWQIYEDTWTSAEMESDPAIVPPAGLYQPVRGFGKIWRTVPGIRETLGWALSPESSFQGAYQVGQDYYARPGGIYLRALSGSILRLGGYDGQGDFWEVLVP